MNLTRMHPAPWQRPISTARPTPARGFTLLAILIMMVVLAFLALGAMNSGILQERMAGNARDRNVALQAGEAALRDAELDLETNQYPDMLFTTACITGLCRSPSDAPPGTGQSAPMWQSIDWATQSRAYGSRSGAAALLGPNNEALASQPQYFVESLGGVSSPGDCASLNCKPGVGARAYRITVRASGVRTSTVVMLQSVYVKQ